MDPYIPLAGILGLLVGFMFASGFYSRAIEIQRLEIDDCWQCIYQLRGQVREVQHSARLAQGIKDTLPYALYVYPN